MIDTGPDRLLPHPIVCFANRTSDARPYGVFVSFPARRGRVPRPDALPVGAAIGRHRSPARSGGHWPPPFSAMKCTGNTSFTSEAQNETRQVSNMILCFEAQENGVTAAVTPFSCSWGKMKN